MNREQAEIKAEVLNKHARHPMISYRPAPVENTRWERERWGVVEYLGTEAVGIAAL